MRFLTASLALVLAVGCRDGSLPTGLSPMPPRGVAADRAAAPTSRVTVSVSDDPSVPALDAMYHTSNNNEWLQFSPQQSGGGVGVSGPARVQFAGGRTRAEGVLTIPENGGTLTIDLAQFDGLAQSPFVQDRPGGGCLVANGVLQVPGQGQIPVSNIMLEWDFPQGNAP
jgi:hypothetical protein